MGSYVFRSKTAMSLVAVSPADAVIACRRLQFGGYAGGTIVLTQSFACTNKRGEDYAQIAAKILPSLRLSPPFGYADRYFPCTIEVEYA